MSSADKRDADRSAHTEPLDDAVYPVWNGEEWWDLTIPVSGGEGVVIPNIAAVIYRDEFVDAVLLQRRDKPGEAVRGRLEVPGGRWRAGESAQQALAREVAEEVGLIISDDAVAERRFENEPRWVCMSSRPSAVVVGVEGTVPSLHVVYECVVAGAPIGRPGETADPAFMPVTEITAMLMTSPEKFTAQTAAILREVLAIE